MWHTYAQCVETSCNSNAGILSNDDAATIAYDNMCSSFHSSFIKEPSGTWKVWGEYLGNDGVTNVLSPINFDVTAYPALTGTIYKMALGSNFGLNVQLIVLTSDGLFVLGTEGTVLDDALTTSSTFQKLIVDNKPDGLPFGVVPEQVKMMFASSGTLLITTCQGEVFALAQNALTRGDGGIGNATQWSQVRINTTEPLTNIIVARGSSATGFALKNDGTLWTWGRQAFLGDGSQSANQYYATQMTLPAGLTGVKMIQATSNENSMSSYANISYYILGTDKKVYALGDNEYGELGDRTAVTRTVWVNALNPDGSIITDAAWISGNEHDENFAALALIKTNGTIYTAGCNSYYMIGRADGGDIIDGGINYLDVPLGISSSDSISFAEAGGHTCALIKQCASKYGYVGHRVRGSIGDGSSLNETIPSYDFVSPPEITVCGTQFIMPTITSNGTICPGENAIFSIVGYPGDVLTYTINQGGTQTVTLAPNGTAQVIVNHVTVSQQINFSHLTSTVGCSYNVSITNWVTIKAPIFTQMPPICQGTSGIFLPTTSDNGFSGTWTPTFNNTQTTTYFFNPTAGSCVSTTQMTVVVIPKSTPLFTTINTLCYGNSTQFSLPLVSDNGIKGTWSPDINPFQTTTYLFTPNEDQCAVPTNLQLTVANQLDFDIDSYCQENKLYIKISAHNFNPNTAALQWTFNNLSIGTNESIEVTNYFNSDTASYTFLLSVTEVNGCSQTKSITLSKNHCDIPNVISPNNDANNDSFDLTAFQVKKLEIYNRWGKKVYEKENYLNEWHGQNETGGLLPDGTYFYVIDFYSESSSKSGWIYIKND